VDGNDGRGKKKKKKTREKRDKSKGGSIRDHDLTEEGKGRVLSHNLRGRGVTRWNRQSGEDSKGAVRCWEEELCADEREKKTKGPMTRGNLQEREMDRPFAKALAGKNSEAKGEPAVSIESLVPRPVESSEGLRTEV